MLLIEVDKRALRKAVTSALSVSNRSEKAPEVHRALMISANDDGVCVHASNGETHVSLTLDASDVKVEQTGAVVLQAELLASILADGSDTRVTLTEQHGRTPRCAISSSGGGVLEVNALPAGLFSVAQPLVAEEQCTLAALELERLVSRTIFCTALDRTRYAIQGILLEVQGARLSAVATDGRRLSRVVANLEHEVPTKRHCIVSTSAAKRLQRLLGTVDAPAHLCFGTNAIEVQAGNVRFQCTLVEGRFPEYERWIPKDGAPITAIVNAAALSHALTLADITTDRDRHDVRCAISAEGIELASQSAECGASQIRLAAQVQHDVTVRINGRYLRDFAKCAGDTQVTLLAPSSHKPIVLLDGQDWVYVVMPLS